MIQRRLEAINARSPFSRPANQYELLFLPQGAKTATILKHYKTLSLLCHPDKGGREDLFKIILQARIFLEDEKARSNFDKYGIEKVEEYLK